MKCPACGKESQGRFCSHCGAPLQPGNCAGCGAALAPGARFCTRCGTAVAGAPRRDTAADNLGWYIAAGVLVVLILAVGLPMVIGRDRTPPPAGVPLSQGTAPTSTAGGAPGPLTGTPREQADRLFNRIMSAREAGDTGQVNLFLPMALQAYRAIELDLDGLYHLAMLEAAGGDFAGGLATANRILQAYPDHLLGLATAAETSARLGDSAASRRHWTRYLEAYPTERVKTLQEYLDHARILPEYEATAKQATGR